MKIDRNTFFTIACVFLVIVGFIVSRIFILERLLKEEKLNNSRLMMDNTLLAETYLSLIKNDKRNMDDIRIFDGKEYFNLSDVLDDNFKLVIRFSELQCSSCLDFILDELVSIKDKGLSSSLLLIGAFRDERTFYQFKKRKDIVYPLYWEKLSLEESEENPSIMLLDRSMEVKCLFYPIKDMAFLLRQYVELVNREYLIFN